MRKIYYADDLERTIGEKLTDLNVEFVHESENKNQQLDFYLPTFDIYIEVKQFYSNRVTAQLYAQQNVILIQGRKSMDALMKLISE